ncbi:MAG: SDR family NAD(P)-dependent oxidoreductase [Burkholderiaceae bacterium]
MNLGIENRIAIVTGASKNIGRAIALELAKEGARVIVVSRSKANLDMVLAELPGADGRHLGIELDLQFPDSPLQLKDLLRGDFENPEIVVHNLGGSLGVTDAFSSAAEWAKVWHFNVGIAHELNRLLIPDMIVKKWGRILHLSTLSTQTYDGYSAYTSAKCALDGYVKSMSRHVSKDNVIMNSLAPGLIHLEGRYFARMQKENPAFVEQYFDNHLPIRRMGTAQEIATIAAFLCSEHAAFMPGSIVRADGGGY